MAHYIKFNDDIESSTISKIDLLASKKKTKAKCHLQTDSRQTKGILKRPKELTPIEAASLLGQRRVSNPKFSYNAVNDDIHTTHRGCLGQQNERRNRPGSPMPNEHHGKVSLPPINGKQPLTNDKQQRGTRSAERNGRRALPAINANKKDSSQSKQKHAFPNLNYTTKKTCLPDINTKGSSMKPVPASRLSKRSADKSQRSGLVGQNQMAGQGRSLTQAQQSSTKNGQTSANILHVLYNLQ